MEFCRCEGEWLGIPSKTAWGKLTALSLLRGMVRGSEFLALPDGCCRAWCSSACTRFLRGVRAAFHRLGSPAQCWEQQPLSLSCSGS